MFVQEESKLCPERCRQGLLVVRIAQIHQLPAGRIIGAGVPLAGLGLDALPGLVLTIKNDEQKKEVFLRIC